MPGVLQLFAVIALSFACVLHLVMSSCALHHHVLSPDTLAHAQSVRVPPVRPLSVLSPDTLAHARGTSEILFYKWPENVLGMG